MLGTMLFVAGGFLLLVRNSYRQAERRRAARDGAPGDAGQAGETGVPQRTRGSGATGARTDGPLPRGTTGTVSSEGTGLRGS